MGEGRSTSPYEPLIANTVDSPTFLRTSMQAGWLRQGDSAKKVTLPRVQGTLLSTNFWGDFPGCGRITTPATMDIYKCILYIEGSQVIS